MGRMSVGMSRRSVGVARELGSEGSLVSFVVVLQAEVVEQHCLDLQPSPLASNMSSHSLLALQDMPNISPTK